MPASSDGFRSKDVAACGWPYNRNCRSAQSRLFDQSALTLRAGRNYTEFVMFGSVSLMLVGT